MPAPSVTPPSTFHALCVYAEPLVTGRRVVVVDDASRGLGSRLLELGARTVHLYDVNPARAREHATGSPRGLTVGELPAGDFDVRDGAFDVAIVPDLAIVLDPPALLARVRRLIGRGGVAIVGAHNAEARFRLSEVGRRPLDYYELYDLVALQFAHVRMVGIMPFVGVALAELGFEGEPEVSVDTQLAVEGTPPEVFIALASQDDVSLAEYAIVQLPSSVLSRQNVESPSTDDRALLASAQLRASLLEAQLDEARVRMPRPGEGAERAEHLAALEASLVDRSTKLKDAEARAADQYERAEGLAEDVLRIEQELGRQRDRVQALDQLRGQEGETLEGVRARLKEMEARLTAREEQIVALSAALDDARTVQTDPEEVAELASRVDGSEARAAVLAAELATIAEAHAGELVQLEATLRERAHELKARTEELTRRDGIVQDLVASLEDGHARLDALALEVARREAELTTNGWRVTELEHQLATRQRGEGSRGGDSGSTPRPPSQEDDNRLRDEIDALRQALAQEHSARVHVESGEELAKARAELARQGTLIEQLSRELEAQDRVRIARESTKSA